MSFFTSRQLWVFPNRKRALNRALKLKKPQLKLWVFLRSPTGQFISSEIRFCTAIRETSDLKQRIKIEIIGKDSFWERAFHVEWESQFPDRALIADGAGHYIADPDWLADLEKVGRETFCSVTRSPDNPRRRQWISSLLPTRPKS